MSGLQSFHAPFNVSVIGASGGIGQAFCRILADDPQVASVHMFSRSEVEPAAAKTVWQPIDIEDEASIERAARSLGDAPMDLVLVLSGILHAGDALQPERRIRELSADKLARVLSVNTIGPALAAKHFLPRMRRRDKSVFAALSARVGSISDNRLGGWASYRASKAALNQLIRTIAIEHSRQHPQSIVVSLHPGTVDTRLSAPFTSRTPADKLFSPQQSAEFLLKVIDDLQSDDSGGFFAWDGSRIEY